MRVLRGLTRRDAAGAAPAAPSSEDAAGARLVGGDGAGPSDSVRGVVFPAGTENAMAGSNDTESNPVIPAGVDTNATVDDRTGAHSSAASRSMPAGSSTSDPSQLAQYVASIVEGLARRVTSLEVERLEHERRLHEFQEAAQSGEAFKQTLREIVLSASVTTEDLQAVQGVLAALATDPNHIMVLASVAQQAGKLTTIVDSFTRLHQAVSPTPPE